jgi:hypothetical protein
VRVQLPLSKLWRHRGHGPRGRGWSRDTQWLQDYRVFRCFWGMDHRSVEDVVTSDIAVYRTRILDCQQYLAQTADPRSAVCARYRRRYGGK